VFGILFVTIQVHIEGKTIRGKTIDSYGRPDIPYSFEDSFNSFAQNGFAF
jgi:hypothetical protein